MKTIELKFAEMYEAQEGEMVGVFGIFGDDVAYEDKVIGEYDLSEEEAEYCVGLPTGSIVLFEELDNGTRRMVV